ncbi:MAG TPA: multidrug effflux MFS transporter [Patescibacteria group bacterium]|nr:multidrug effflux MFS transporter [Patescibacteria group bacterium]
MVVDKKKLVLVLAMTLALGLSSTDIYLASLPRLAEEFHVDADWANLTLSVYTAGMALGCLLCGFASDRFGRRRMYLGALGAYVVASAAIGMMPDLEAVIALRFVQGLVVAVFVITSRQVIADICDEQEMVKYTAILTMGIILSPALAPVIGAYIAHFSSWRMCFWVSAAFGLIMLLLVAWRLPETLPQPRPLPAAGNLLREYREILQNRQFLCYASIITLCYCAFFSFLTMSSFIYISELGVDPRWFSKIFILLALVYLIGNTTLQRLNARNTAKEKMVYWGLLISLAGAYFSLLAMLAWDHLWIGIILSVGAAMMRGAYALLQAPAQVLTMLACSDRPGTTVGLIFFLQFVAGALTSAGVSVFHEYAIGATVITMAVCLTLAMAAYGVERRRVATAGV